MTSELSSQHHRTHNQMKTVIAFIHGVGDNLMATPAIRAYKAQHPDESITLVVRGDTDAAHVWEGNPYVDGVIKLERPYPDYWHPKYYFMDRAPLVRRLRAIRDEIGASKLKHLTVNTLPMIAYRVIPHPHKTVKIASELGVRLGSTEMEVFPAPRHRALANDFLSAYLPDRKRIIAINRTGSAPYKYWALEKYEELIHALTREGFAVVGCYTKASADLELAIDGRRAHIPSENYAETLQMDGHLLTTAALFDRCEAVISVDSAPMHLAAAVGVPTIAIFTATRHDLYRPLDVSSVVLTGQPTARAVHDALFHVIRR